MTTGYRRYVQPGHPVVQRIFGDRRPQRRDALATAVEVLGAEPFEYRPYRGMLEFDDLERALAEGRPRIWLNCLTYCCLAVSWLRKLGLGSREVFVAIGESHLLTAEARNDLHAWVLVVRPGDDGGLESVEPILADITVTRAEELEDAYRVHGLFNDHFLHVVPAERRRALTGVRRGHPLQPYLYGRYSPEISGILGEPGFRPLLAAVFAGEGTTEELRPLAQRAVDAQLLADLDPPTPGERLVTVSKDRETAFLELAQPWLDRYLGLCLKGARDLERAYGELAVARHHPWEAVCHTLVAGFLMDLAIGHQLALGDEVRENHSSAVVWAFEWISADNAFGVQWLPAGRPGSGYGQLWHRTTNRRPLRLGRAAIQRLLDHAGDGPAEEDAKTDLWLRYQKLLRGSPEPRPVPPYFSPEDAGRLVPLLMEAGRRLVEEAVAPCLAAAAEDPVWGPIADLPGSSHAGVRLLLEYATDRLVDAGGLAPFPATGTAGPEWGRWLWEEPEAGDGFLGTIHRSLVEG